MRAISRVLIVSAAVIVAALSTGGDGEIGPPRWQESRILRVPAGPGETQIRVGDEPYPWAPTDVRLGADSTWWVLVRGNAPMMWKQIAPPGEIVSSLALVEHFAPLTSQQRLRHEVPDALNQCTDFLPTEDGICFTCHGRLFLADAEGQVEEVLLGGVPEGLYPATLWRGRDGRTVVSLIGYSQFARCGVCVLEGEEPGKAQITEVASAQHPGLYRSVVACDGVDYFVVLSEKTTGQPVLGDESLARYTMDGTLVYESVFPRPWPKTRNDLSLFWPERDWAAVSQVDMSKSRAEAPGETAIYDLRTGARIAGLPIMRVALPCEAGWVERWVTGVLHPPMDTGEFLRVKFSRDYWELWSARISGLPPPSKE